MVKGEAGQEAQVMCFGRQFALQMEGSGLGPSEAVGRTIQEWRRALLLVHGFQADD